MTEQSDEVMLNADVETMLSPRQLAAAGVLGHDSLQLLLDK